MKEQISFLTWDELTSCYTMFEMCEGRFYIRNNSIGFSLISLKMIKEVFIYTFITRNKNHPCRSYPEREKDKKLSLILSLKMEGSKINVIVFISLTAY